MLSRPCSDLSFLSSSGSKIPDLPFIFVENELSWPDAQLYCRKYYTDLASVRNERENKEIQLLANNKSVWIGLYRSGHVTYVRLLDEWLFTWPTYLPLAPRVG